ncbi:unnamed protein product [Protopolystoma xenopodis]|uniref:Spondin-like TSP1 domain-containing protein n=1 Tax=Protopolystoma xenopodis TaxID=117903 RepID=A0A3S5BBW5_9PLAT|nr:unnamed protein product [Protopolystoma xenopodis]
MTGQESGIDSSDMQRLSQAIRPRQDCELSVWSGWGPCSAICASHKPGVQWRFRHIKRPARQEGKPCGLLYEKRECIETKC